MKAIPEGFNTITPTLVITGAAKALDLYKKAFGAKEVYRMNAPNSDKIMHACLEIGNSRLFMCDTNPEAGCGTPSQASFYLYMENVDEAFKKAKQAGMQEVMAPQDMFWGDRTGNLTDSFGIKWTVASHVRDVSDSEIQDAVKKMTKAA